MSLIEEMNQDRAWSNWQVIERIGGGGQGNTFKVQDADNRMGVLKTLRDQSDAKARKRMFREVSNLKQLATTECRVPEVLDSNVDAYDEASQELYLVMTVAQGIPLQELVMQRGQLDADKSLMLCIDLAKTLKHAHEVNILHRDIKPENLIVAETQSGIAGMIVDFGLSFNEVESSDLTSTQESIANKFLDLPERKSGSSKQRDLRSDVTGIVGILFYCLTGKPPGQLLCERGLQPHRRPEHKFDEIMSGYKKKQELVQVLNCGFSVKTDDRFSTAAELIERLQFLRKDSEVDDSIDVKAIAIDWTQRLQRDHRKTQIEEFRPHALQTIRGYPKTGLSRSSVHPRCRNPWNSLVDFSQRMHRRR